MNKLFDWDAVMDAAHAHASNHREEILGGAFCGCFYCCEQFRPDEIKKWIDEEQTAMCPKCGIDSVIGSSSGVPVAKEFLSLMHKYWFEE